MKGQSHPDAGTEVKTMKLEGTGATLDVLKRWIEAHVERKYDLLEWNCQHFCDVVMSLFASSRMFW
jgi:hypothetical protein